MTSQASIPSEFMEVIADLDWFHPVADRHIAESLLMHNGVDGSYLLRYSKKEALAISVRCKDSVKHFPLTFEDSQVRFGLASFSSADEFTSHFHQQPFIGGESGVITWLKHPYPREVQEPDLYDKVKIHAQYKEQDVSNKHTHQLAIGSKEGYLTKMGGFVKNWKVRWFVIKGTEMRYYKDASEATPIRILNLRECTECDLDTTFSRPYCFKVVFPWRTFYLACESESDRSEWVKLISWKLEHLKTVMTL